MRNTSKPKVTKAMAIFLFLLLNLTCYIAKVNCQRFDIDDEIVTIVDHRRRQVYDIADFCVEKNGGTALGQKWLECVMAELEKGEQQGELGPFPLPSYTVNPLTLQHKYEDGINHGTLLGDLLRNYTCGRVQDGSSDPIEIKEWVYDEKNVMQESLYRRQSCPSKEDFIEGYRKIRGFLPAGNDLEYNADDVRSVQDAKKWCNEMAACEGFTFPKGTNSFYFKSRNAKVSDVNPNSDWTTYARRFLPTHCKDGETYSDSQEIPDDAYAAAPQTYQAKVIRHEPLVIVVPNFLTAEDCNALIDAGGSEEEMGAAHEQGGPSSYRRSFSSNIHVDYDNRTAHMTRIAEKHFALVRHFTGYNVHGNHGQEPINAVLYKNIGDEYRPHCDGPCHGGDYPHGSRVATSIVYCKIADGGSGQTSFTRSGIMVAPQQYDILLFAYRYKNFTMDNGFTEHSGCPIKAGKKWIATQWYREGVEDDIPWDLVEELDNEEEE